MGDVWTGELLSQLELHWERQLRPRLAGLGDDEYFWEPAPGAWGLRWRAAEARWVGDFTIPPPEPAPVTTIGWRIRHLVGVVHGMRSMPPFTGASWDFATFPSPGTAAGALAQLDDAVARWTADVRALGDDGLLAPFGSGPEGWTVAGIVLHVHRELIHHGAEIALLRDLYPHGVCERTSGP
ncbi:DinB family protein [Actinomycetospora aeridis]|uniref:DinB family protein n=1 Tax=Actinomycetospora aeridis TaxID=3129231 RepID=A0ABU8N214_9PSEU